MKSPTTDHPTDETEAIRSEINTTRHRMDETIDALGRRLKGRHLVDEALHLFRKQQENGNMTKLTHKISESADTAYHSVVDTIKAHPVPVALVGAGVGWLIYERSRSHANTSDISAYRVRPYDDDFSPGPLSGEHSSSAGLYGEEAAYGHSSSSSVKEKASEAMGQLQDKACQVRDRLAGTTAQAKEQTLRFYEKSKQSVSEAVDHHPLQSGLVCLAVGLLAGLLIPTPRRLSQSLEPKARELNERLQGTANDLIERGTHVVESATEAATKAAKKEAKNQGLTSEGGGSPSESSERKDRPVSAM